MGLDVRPPEQAESLGGVEHALAVHLELRQVQHDRRRRHFGQRPAYEPRPQLLLQRGVCVCRGRHVGREYLRR